MRLGRVASSIGLLAGLVLGQSQSTIYQQHEYTVDWEDWPSILIDGPAAVTVCYHEQSTSFSECVDFCTSETGKTPLPTDPVCDMIVTASNFERDLRNFDWTAFANHTTAGETYQFIFVLQSEDRSDRNVFSAGEFVMVSANAAGVPADSPTAFIIEAKAVDVPRPGSSSSDDASDDVIEVAVPTTNPSAPSSTATAGDAADGGGGGSSTHAGTIIGGVLGGVLGGAIITLAAVFLFRRRQQQTAAPSSGTAPPAFSMTAAGPSSRGYGGDVEAAGGSHYAGTTIIRSPSVATSSEKKAESTWVSEVDGTRPIAELAGDQAAELATVRMSRVGVATTDLGPARSGSLYDAQSPTLGNPHLDVSPVESLGGRRS